MKGSPVKGSLGNSTGKFRTMCRFVSRDRKCGASRGAFGYSCHTSSDLASGRQNLAMRWNGLDPIWGQFCGLCAGLIIQADLQLPSSGDFWVAGRRGKQESSPGGGKLSLRPTPGASTQVLRQMEAPDLQEHGSTETFYSLPSGAPI